MKVIWYFLLLTFLFSSCLKEEERNSENISGLKVIPVTPSFTRASKDIWNIGDEIGIYTTYGSLSNPYFGVPSNAISLFDGNEWIPTPIYLTGALATIYGYYPYNPAAGNGQNIPIELDSQTDYLHGKGDRQVNMENASVIIEMEHVLSRILFQIRKVDYPQKAVLKKLSVTGTSTFPVYTTGTFNCETGVITPFGTNSVLELSYNNELQDNDNEVHEVFLFPLTRPLIADGDITATFEIETDIQTEKYLVQIPAGIYLEKGNSYMCPLTLNGYGLYLNSSDITIIPWSDSNTGKGSTM